MDTYSMNPFCLVAVALGDLCTAHNGAIESFVTSDNIRMMDN